MSATPVGLELEEQKDESLGESEAEMEIEDNIIVN